VRFWDASAIIPLVVGESKTPVVEKLLADDREITAWWGTIVECASAVARRERSGEAMHDEVASMLERLGRLQTDWQEIAPTDDVRLTAQRFLRVHPLRSADALQLAAAIVAAEGSPQTLEFVSLDARLRAAAQREGFSVLEI